MTTTRKRTYFKLPPNLGDGYSSEVVEMIDSLVLERLQAWADESMPGESIEIECVEMTAEEFEALPEL